MAADKDKPLLYLRVLGPGGNPREPLDWHSLSGKANGVPCFRSSSVGKIEVLSAAHICGNPQEYASACKSRAPPPLIIWTFDLKNLEPPFLES